MNIYSAFLAACELGSHIQAAEQLGLTQRQMIAAISAVEEELNAPLLICRRQSAWLTAEGQAALEEIRRRSGAAGGWMTEA